MKRDPFRIEGPALIQFSGGRTSAYMLWRILQAHEGRLPDDVHVCFENTGLEWPTTYAFVQQCSARWGVRIRWLEWRPDAPGFEEVGPNSADRDGVWFKSLIARRRFLPNSVTRFCTIVLKARTSIAFARAQGWDTWTSCIGIRFDEKDRYLRGVARNNSGKEAYDCDWPLYHARIRKDDVRDFWRVQPFDLMLPDDSPAFGNCDLCHLKAREKLLEVMLYDIRRADWWVEQERAVTEMIACGDTKTVIVDGLFGEEELPAGENAARFRRDGWTYAEMQEYVRRYPGAAQAEVDRFKREITAGDRQPDLLENCICGVGA